MTRRARPTGSPAEGGGKRDEVLRIACDYFLSHGYHGASINAMARESGISKESIYRYFHGKQDLFKAVIGHELELYQTRLAKVHSFAAHHDLEEALLAFAEQMVLTLASEPTLSLRRLIFHEATKAPEVGRHYFEIGPNLAYRTLQTVFETHRRRTVFAPKDLARYFIAMLLQPLFLERECAIRKPMRAPAARTYATRVVGDFLQAFFSK